MTKRSSLNLATINYFLLRSSCNLFIVIGFNKGLKRALMVLIDVRIVLGQKTARNDIFNESGKRIFLDCSLA